MKPVEIIPTAVISGDPEFRELFQDDRIRRQLDLVIEIGGPLAGFGPDRSEELVQRDPGLVFLDLQDEPTLGCGMARTFAAGLPPRRVIAIGPMQPPEFLLQAMQSGISEYLTKPVTAGAVLEAIDRARPALAPRGGAKQRVGQLLAFFGLRGGVGTTTVAANAGILLHRTTGGRTVLVDLHLELGDLAVFLGLEPRYHLADVASSLHRMDAGLLGSLIEPHPSGVSLLAAPYHPEMGGDVTVEHVGRILTLLRAHFDYVVVDGLKSLTPRTLRAFELANEIFVVLQQDVLSVQGFQRCQPLFERLRQSGRTVRVLVNRYDPRHEITIEDLEKSLEMDVHWTLPNDYESIAHSINTGKPVAMAAGSPIASELESMIARIGNGAVERQEPRGRLLGSVFGRLRDRWGSASTPTAGPQDGYLLPPIAARE